MQKTPKEPKSLLEHQLLFSHLIGKLLVWANENTKYGITVGDFWRSDSAGHKPNSCHYIRLAADLNLFLDGKYLTDTESHKELGAFWKSLHPLCRWGGDFKAKDGNHYSITYQGRA